MGPTSGGTLYVYALAADNTVILTGPGGLNLVSGLSTWVAGVTSGYVVPNLTPVTLTASVDNYSDWTGLAVLAVFCPNNSNAATTVTVLVTSTTCCSFLTTITGTSTFTSGGVIQATTGTNTSCVSCSTTTTTTTIFSLAALTTDNILLVTAAAAIGVAVGYVLSKRKPPALQSGPKGTPKRRTEKGL